MQDGVIKFKFSLIVLWVRFMQAPHCTLSFLHMFVEQVQM